MLKNFSSRSQRGISEEIPFCCRPWSEINQGKGWWCFKMAWCDLGQIFSFVLEQHAFEPEYRTAKLTYLYWTSGFVGEISYYSLVAGKNCPVNCEVRPSIKLSEEDREQWIVLDQETGRVLTAWCTCTAGTSQCCNHTVAVLYKWNMRQGRDTLMQPAPAYHAYGTNHQKR